ncbi:hypothetical protein GIV63_30160, partial [Pseudomonas sp. PA-3-10C]|nr:hypothetical protein [Pseudomonas sp. PA-3-6E]MCF5597261.1 hypothetical protein [Pseudomonas sp. PA-3-10C]
MQLNTYQSQVIEDLELFLRRWTACDDPQLAYRAHWDALGATKMPGYQQAPHGAPQVCAKVPTAGGKTFIGLHAVSSIFSALQKRQGDARLCLWLVPSLSILDQVLRVRIPRHLDTQPTIIWTLVPCSLGHLIHVHLDRQSERSDAGLH